ncbi:MAG: hypothetical protein IKT32_08270 [Clostridia bacterium]|nr:hypothetical protein [Clostridia bacterium]
MKKTVVISSVIEKEDKFLEYRYAAKLAAESLGYTVRRNNEDFGSNQTQFNQFLDSDRPIFIILLGDIQSEMVKEECKRAIKNNLHIIPFFKVANRDAHIPQSALDLLNEISPPICAGDCMKFWSGEGLYNHITRALKNLEEKTFAPAVLNRGHGKIYEHASKMLEDAKQEYILCQKSSTLILGPNKSRADEISYYENLMAWLANETRKFNGKHIKFTHIFSLEKTRLAIESNKANYDIASAKERFMSLLPNLSNCLFINTDWQNNSHPFVISDGDMLVDLYFTGAQCNVKLHQDLIDYHSFAEMRCDIGSSGEILLNIGDAPQKSDKKFFEQLYSKSKKN